jgi:hypothetical protein
MLPRNRNTVERVYEAGYFFYLNGSVHSSFQIWYRIRRINKDGSWEVVQDWHVFKTLTANSGGIKNGIDRRNSNQAADWWVVRGKGPTPHYRSVQENQSGDGSRPYLIGGMKRDRLNGAGYRKDGCIYYDRWFILNRNGTDRDRHQEKQDYGGDGNIGYRKYLRVHADQGAELSPAKIGTDGCIGIYRTQDYVWLTGWGTHVGKQSGYLDRVKSRVQEYRGKGKTGLPMYVIWPGERVGDYPNEPLEVVTFKVPEE